MTINSEQVAVGDEPTALNGYDAASSHGERRGARLLVKVPSTAGASVFLGGSDVDEGGFEVEPGEAVGIDVENGEILYGIVAAGSQTVHVLRGGA